MEDKKLEFIYLISTLVLFLILKLLCYCDENKNLIHPESNNDESNNDELKITIY